MKGRGCGLFEAIRAFSWKYCRKTSRVISSNTTETVQNEAKVAYFEVLSHKSSGQTEENQEKC
jgi:hypothetical protein